MASVYESDDRSQESSPEPQIPHPSPQHHPLNDQTNAPINANGPIVVDDFSVRGQSLRLFRFPGCSFYQKDEESEFNSDSDLTSLSSSVLEYEYENGRRYHSNRTVRMPPFYFSMLSMRSS